MDALECRSTGRHYFWRGKITSALLLAWKQPNETNGILNGYRIYYQEVERDKLGPLLERKPRVMNGRADKAILAGLKPGMKYRVTIRATTKAGEGVKHYTECETPQASQFYKATTFIYSLYILYFRS